MNALVIPPLVGPVLLSEFQDANHSFTNDGTTTLNSKTVNVIETVSTVPVDTYYVTAQTWYLDAATRLPVRVEYKVPAVTNPGVSFTGALDFSDWRPVFGTLYPFHIVRYWEGRQVEVITVQSVNLNGTISASDFDPPTGGAQ